MRSPRGVAWAAPLLGAWVVAQGCALAPSRTAPSAQETERLRRLAEQGGFSQVEVVAARAGGDGRLRAWGVNPTVDTREAAESRLPVQVGTASYQWVRECLQRGELPSEETVRVEEFINAFHEQAAPGEAMPWRVRVEGVPSPNRKGYHLLYVAVRWSEGARPEEVRVAFAPEAVARWRLLGFEGLPPEGARHASEEPGRRALGALYEVRLREGGAALGAVHVRWKGGAPRPVQVPVTREVVRGALSSAGEWTRLAVVAGLLGEKLRGSYWARTLGYEELLKQWEALPRKLREQPEVTELREWVERARMLDRRSDRFEEVAPVEAMGFDEVPVVP